MNFGLEGGDYLTYLHIKVYINYNNNPHFMLLYVPKLLVTALITKTRLLFWMWENGNKEVKQFIDDFTVMKFLTLNPLLLSFVSVFCCCCCMMVINGSLRKVSWFRGFHDVCQISLPPSQAVLWKKNQNHPRSFHFLYDILTKCKHFMSII